MRPCVPGRKVNVIVSLCIDHTNSFSSGRRRSRPVVSATRSEQILVALPGPAKAAVMTRDSSTKSREIIWGGRICSAKVNAESARQRAKEAAREADRAEAFYVVIADGRLRWSRPTIPNHSAMLNGGYGWLEVKCRRCETRASLPLDAIRRPRDTPIWKLESALKCRACRTPRYAPPVHMIRLTETQEIAPYLWVHPDDER